MSTGTIASGSGSARSVFETIQRHQSPGAALGAKLLGRDAVEHFADGASVTLSDGRSVIDFGSYAVTLLGHRHPAVVAAVIKQLELMPTATRVLANPAVAALVAALCRLGSLERVWLGTNGADAVEVAVKLARRVSGRMRILAVDGAFHGKSAGALALTWHPSFRVGLEPLLTHVTHIDPNEHNAVADEVARGDVAALIVEPIQGENGVRPLTAELLKRWAADAHMGGAFLISDEVQTGLTRCGDFSIADAMGLRPDAVLFGKALGGGVMPLSAMLATDEFYEPLASDPTWHSTTFGGHPLSCAAGLAALNELALLAPRRVALEHALREHLGLLHSTFRDVLVEIRGCGLLWGIELATAGEAGELLLELARRGLLTSPCLSSSTTIRIAPPLTTTDDQLGQAMEILAASIDSL